MFHFSSEGYVEVNCKSRGVAIFILTSCRTLKNEVHKHLLFPLACSYVSIPARVYLVD